MSMQNASEGAGASGSADLRIGLFDRAKRHDFLRLSSRKDVHRIVSHKGAAPCLCKTLPSGWNLWSGDILVAVSLTRSAKFRFTRNVFTKQ